MPYPMNFNPMQPQQYQGYFTPNMQQQLQMQQLQQIPMQQTSTGKVVDSVDIVRVTDIPMDGNAYYFPKADMSEVYSKRWLPNGSTEINTYVKVDVNQMEENKNTFENNLMDKLDSISDRIDKLEKNLIPKTNSRTKEA